MTDCTSQHWCLFHAHCEQRVRWPGQFVTMRHAADSQQAQQTADVEMAVIALLVALVVNVVVQDRSLG